MKKINSPLFVMGTQRSGTTLLCKILSTHPKLFIQNETNLKRVFADHGNKQELQQCLINDIESTWNKNFSEIMGEAEIWGLKEPSLQYFIKDIEKFIPESKFIITIRDPRAVVNSYKKNKWGLGTNAYTGSLRWIKEIKLQLAFAEKYKENTLVVFHDSLVEEPRPVLNKICHFLEIEFLPEMLDFYKGNKNSPVLKSRETISTFSPLDSKLSKMWEVELNKREVGIIETLTSDYMQKFNFEKVAKRIEPSMIEIIYYKLQQKILGEIQLQYRWRKSIRKNKKTDKNN